MKFRHAIWSALLILLCFPVVILVKRGLQRDEMLGKNQFFHWCANSQDDVFSWSGKYHSYVVSRIRLKESEEYIYIATSPKEYAPAGMYYVYPSEKLAFGCNAAWDMIKDGYEITPDK